MIIKSENLLGFFEHNIYAFDQLPECVELNNGASVQDVSSLTFKMSKHKYGGSIVVNKRKFEAKLVLYNNLELDKKLSFSIRLLKHFKDYKPFIHNLRIVTDENPSLLDIDSYNVSDLSWKIICIQYLLSDANIKEKIELKLKYGDIL